MDLFRENENDFSFWFPKFENCGIAVPKSFYAIAQRSAYWELRPDKEKYQ